MGKPTDEKPAAGSTTGAGAPAASDRNSLTIGADGPILLHDVHFLEQMAHFNRENVPERRPHAKGAGAFGILEITEDVSKGTKAALLQPGAKTDMLARFSTVAGELGSPDTWRDVRGFSLKFYADESNYDLVGMAAYIVILTVMATFLYFTRLQMVAELGDDIDLRATVFARIDLITQVVTLLLQAVIAGQLMQRLGVAITVALLPLTMALGFIGLAMVGSLAMLIVFEATFRAIQRAITRPARETLYTVVSREDKYKSKAFIDTFVYRSGDVIGAQVEGGLGRLGLGLGALAAVAVPLALVWALLGMWLGRSQQRLAAAGIIESTAAISPPNPPEARSTP